MRDERAHYVVCVYGNALLNDICLSFEAALPRKKESIGIQSQVRKPSSVKPLQTNSEGKYVAEHDILKNSYLL